MLLNVLWQFVIVSVRLPKYTISPYQSSRIVKRSIQFKRRFPVLGVMVKFGNKLPQPIKVMRRAAILREDLTIKPRENGYRIRL